MDPTAVGRCPEETAEIEKHKYFLSEQAGYDVGWEVAEQDWEANHADEFRRRTSSKSQETDERSGTLFSRLLAKARRR